VGDENSNPPRPKRRWYQYSLRTLFLLMTLFALWLGVNIHRARQQKEAVEAIVKAGGGVQYDSGARVVPHGYDGSGPAPSWLAPPWLRRQLGDDFFDDVTGVYFKGVFQERRSHDPWGPSQDIDLNALAHLKSLRELKRLDLRRMAVKDRGLVHVEGLVGLEVLNLKLTEVTDEGLAHLSGLTNLRELDLSNNRITDSGLVHLAGMTRLENLRLNWTKVTDAGLVHLAETTRLERLSLNWTKVTDAGLQHLAGLPQLRYVSLEHCGVTDEGVKKLQETLPKCTIQR
jgi:hypothetical protein